VNGDIPVDIPAWAIEAGMPQPFEGETFKSYWTRVGVSDRVVAKAFKGLTDQTAEVANARMHTYLVRTMRKAFTKHVDALADRWAR
jgi:hypothetical protein